VRGHPFPLNGLTVLLPQPEAPKHLPKDALSNSSGIQDRGNPHDVNVSPDATRRRTFAVHLFEIQKQSVELSVRHGFLKLGWERKARWVRNM
jgi:hypothetical protein